MTLLKRRLKFNEINRIKYFTCSILHGQSKLSFRDKALLPSHIKKKKSLQRNVSQFVVKTFSHLTLATPVFCTLRLISGSFRMN